MAISRQSEFSSTGFTNTTSGNYSTRKPSIAGVPALVRPFVSLTSLLLLSAAPIRSTMSRPCRALPQFRPKALRLPKWTRRGGGVEAVGLLRQTLWPTHRSPSGKILWHEARVSRAMTPPVTREIGVQLAYGLLVWE